MAHLHGRPWLPWQRSAADIIGELLPNGRYAYPVAIVLVPRQCGKTTWILDVAQGRCLVQADYRAAYTAQTGMIATERFTERMTAAQGTALASRMTGRRSQGSERMTFPRGSYVKAFPPKDGALRGSALDLVVIDEPQEITDAAGKALDQTILPTFTTRPRRQMVLVGTAGTDLSQYLARYLALARAGADGIAVIEYGATPEDDPTDPDVWDRTHPGLAAGLTDHDALASALAVMGPAGFAREYLNVWQAAGDRTISAAAWTVTRNRDAVPAPADRPTFGVDVAMDRTAAAVVACWPDSEGLPVVEVVDYQPGVEWVAARVRELRQVHRGDVWIDGGTGPASTVAADLGDHPWVHRVGTREYTAACAGFLDKITDRMVAHRGEPSLDAAVAGAVRRPVADGWGWGRRSSTADISPLVAASLALHGHRHRPAAPAPRVITAD